MRTALTALTAVAAAAALTACSSATAGSAQHPGRPVQPSQAAQTSTATVSKHPTPYPSSAPAPDPSSTPRTASGTSDVDQALLAASDLGRDFAAGAPDEPSSLPCTPDRPPVDEQVHHVEKGDAVYVDDLAGTQVSEQIYVYRTPGEAVRHQSILEAGLSCRRGSMQGRPVTLLGPTDVRRQLRLHTDSAQVWIARTGQVSAALVALRIRAVVVQFAVVAEDGAESNLDVKKVVVAGLTKLYAVARG